MSLMGKFLLGLSAGALATCSNMPFDVAKSRIQGPPPVHQPNKYKHTLKSIAIVYREEGYVLHCMTAIMIIFISFACM